jgi:peptide chain release factor
MLYCSRAIDEDNNTSTPTNSHTDITHISDTHYISDSHTDSPYLPDKPSAKVSKKTGAVPRAPFQLRPEDIVETVAKGGGPGGQSVNKSSNRVRLRHVPTGIIVACQDYRDLTSNRKHAMTMLREKVEFAVNGAQSKIGKKIDKIRKQKSKRKQRSKAKLSSDQGDKANVVAKVDEYDSTLLDSEEYDSDDDDNDDLDTSDILDTSDELERDINAAGISKS